MVRVELTVVDDKAAATWRARQTAAIRALLEWAAEQPNPNHDYSTLTE